MFTKENAKEIGSLGGRPKGYETEQTRMKRIIREKIVQFAHDNIDALMAEFKGNPKMVAHLLDQAIGKAPQMITMASDAENPLKVLLVEKMPDVNTSAHDGNTDSTDNTSPEAIRGV